MAKNSFSPLDSCSIRPGQAWLQIETKYQGKVLQQQEMEQFKNKLQRNRYCRMGNKLQIASKRLRLIYF